LCVRGLYIHHTNDAKVIKGFDPIQVTRISISTTFFALYLVKEVPVFPVLFIGQFTATDQPGFQSQKWPLKAVHYDKKDGRTAAICV